ncbi:hypothetical protein B0T20DRAFT_487879 [Sordaria brevicollis]|uniref:Uncharacterized protein n=1 Tax=Sordaria brevicollis TaxID=83679 RepID=A0AAE0P353_SORBR|nr:hypothetical protein B0T20DRAFT_487879 [Sordaria brevicollis]
MAPHVTPTTKLQIIGAFKLLRFLKSRPPSSSGTSLCSNNDIFRLFSVSRTTGYRVLSEISASSFSDLTLTERLALDAEAAQALEDEENARIASLLSSAEAKEETRGRKRKLTERDVEVIEAWLDRNGGRGDVKWKDVPEAAGLGVIEGKNGVGVLSGVTVKRALQGWRERNREVDVEDWTRARGKGGLRGSEKARERWGRPKGGEAQGAEGGGGGGGGTGGGSGNGGGSGTANGQREAEGQREEEEEGSESESDDDVVETGPGTAQSGAATASGSAPAPGTATTPGTSSTPGYAGVTPDQTETQEHQNKKRRSASGPTGPDPRNLWNNRWEIEQAAIARREAEAKAAARAQLKINAAAAAKERYRLNRQRKRQQQKLEKQQQQERERLEREQAQQQQNQQQTQQQTQQGQTQQQNQSQPSYTGGQQSYAPGQQPQSQPQLPHPQPHHQNQYQQQHQQRPQQAQRPFTSMSFIPLPTYAQPSAPGSSSGSGPSSAHQSFNNPSSSTSNWNSGNPSSGGAGGEAEDIMMLGRLSGVIR